MDRTAVVTGAARGIGPATARAFLAEGRRVAMVDVDEGELAHAADGLDGAVALPCDVSDEAAVAAPAPAVEGALGRVDVLVNDAGAADFGPIEETTSARWRTAMATNLDGAFPMSQAFVPARKATRWAIVDVASISAPRASTLRVAYGTGKAGVAHLTSRQAVELGEHGIRANCVCPGPVRTELARAVHTPDIVAASHDAIPLGRYGGAEEIAAAILWLCSDGASFAIRQRPARRRRVRGGGDRPAGAARSNRAGGNRGGRAWLSRDVPRPGATQPNGSAPPA